MPPVATDEPASRAVMRHAHGSTTQKVILYSVELGSPTPRYPFGRETFISRDDAERFVDEVRGDEPELAAKLRIEERDLEAGGLN